MLSMHSINMWARTLCQDLHPKKTWPLAFQRGLAGEKEAVRKQWETWQEQCSLSPPRLLNQEEQMLPLVEREPSTLGSHSLISAATIL